MATSKIHSSKAIQEMNLKQKEIRAILRGNHLLIMKNIEKNILLRSRHIETHGHLQGGAHTGDIIMDPERHPLLIIITIITGRSIMKVVNMSHLTTLGTLNTEIEAAEDRPSIITAPNLLTLLNLQVAAIEGEAGIESLANIVVQGMAMTTEDLLHQDSITMIT